MSAIKREWFEDTASYEAFIWASKAAAKMQQYIDDGYTISDINERSIAGKFETVLDEMGSIVCETTICGKHKWFSVLAGSTHSCVDGTIYVELDQVKKNFSEYNIVKPTDIFSLEM